MTSKHQVAEASVQYLADAAGHALPVGYKQTEVGVIPEDWTCCNLGDALTLQRGFDLPQRLRNEGHVPIISSSGASGKHNKAMVAAPGIVTGRYGTIGEIFYIQEPFWPLNTTLYVSKFNHTSAEYAYYLLQTVDFDSHSGKSGVPGVNRNDVHQEKIAIPPIPEQTAIANALSDVDALINELEKLIAKKHAIKTATMQQLLTGRIRLTSGKLKIENGELKNHSQFSILNSQLTKQSELGEIPEDWEVCDLSSVCSSFKTGKLDANAMKQDGEYRFYTCARDYYYIDCFAFDTEALLVSGNGANVGYVHYYKGKFNAYQRTYVLSDFSASIGYLKIYMERKLADRIRVEVNAGNTPYITMDTLTDMPVLLPTNYEEQSAIATILSDMDAEIQTLQQRLNKTRQIKQGMMQELLTGRIRLVNGELKMENG